MSAVTHFGRNPFGFDYIMGDAHGCLELVEQALSDIGFNEHEDRLFSVGDLVDRGADSLGCVALLDKPWFHAVRGNHEQMAIDYARGDSNDFMYQMNGGDWFIALPKDRQQQIAGRFSRMPIAIELETAAGLLGIIHAECPVDWPDVMEQLDDDRVWHTWSHVCMWSRDRFNHRVRTPVGGVRAVVVGHTPTKDPLVLGNVHYIDTGAVFGGRLTIIEAESLEEATVEL